MVVAICLVIGAILGFKAGKYWFTYELLRCCQSERNREKLIDILAVEAERLYKIDHTDDTHLPA